MALPLVSLYSETTIVAIATPPGYGGIGVIRLSGPQSLSFTRRLIDRELETAPNRVSLHQLKNPDTGQVIDEALVTWFRAPHSYTGEDVIEISCHGSPVVLAEVVKVLRSFGAELARPGEFTMRAFFNQRLDLAQAEAINDLIHSQTSYQAQVAARQLRGELSTQLKPVKSSLIEMIVHFESSVEFVEDDLDALNIKRFTGVLDDLGRRLEALISTWRLGRLVRVGIKLAIVGRPNVGKSSLFNRMLGRERAIVTDIPGTTRDTLSEVHSINGIPVELIDTAGIRETFDLVERLGVERTQTAIAEADFVLGIIEANHEPAAEELAALMALPLDQIIINKCDLEFRLSEETVAKLRAQTAGRSLVRVSALTGEGLDDLANSITDALTSGARIETEGALITNERHVAALEQALTALHRAHLDLSAGLTEEVVLVSLHEALRALGLITGETLVGDIINQIFTTFCIGK